MKIKYQVYGEENGLGLQTSLDQTEELIDKAEKKTMRFSFPFAPRCDIFSYALDRALEMDEKELASIVGKKRAKEIKKKKGNTPVSVEAVQRAWNLRGF